jgi:hypothetical protein
MPLGCLGHLVEHPAPHRWIANDSGPSICLVTTSFELGFDEDDEIPVVRDQGPQGIEDDAKRDERQVGDHDVGRGANDLLAPGITAGTRRQIAHVAPLDNGHSSVGSELLVHLPVTDIDRHHRTGATLQQAVGEPTSRCPNVHSRPTGNIQPKHHEGSIKLLAAAPDESGAGSLHDDGFAVGHQPAGLIGDGSRHEHVPGLNTFSCPSAR